MKKTILIATPLALALVGAIGCAKKQTASYEYGTEKVKNEQFIVAFSEGGQLEAVNSVKVETEMDGSSTIVNIVDEGTTVKGPRQVKAQVGDTPGALAQKHGVSEDSLRHVNPDLEDAIKNGKSITIPGDMLVELDPGSLKERILNQELAVRTAKNSVTKAQNDLEIQKLKNQQSIEDALINVNFAKLDMEKFKMSDAKLKREDFEGQLNNYSNSVSISEAKLVYLRELEKKQFLSKMSLREEEQKVAEFRHKIKMLRGESDAYEQFVYPKSKQNFNSLIKQAELSLTTVQQTATNNVITATTDLDTQKQKLALEEEQLVEVKDQMNKTRIYAPSPGLVVYHLADSSRHSGSSGIIEKGVTVRKGQDIIQLPDLSKMMVALKIHESRFKNVRGRKGYKTKKDDTVVGIAERHNVTEKDLRRLNEKENEKLETNYISRELEITIPGMFVQVMIEGFDRPFNGEVTYVAPVADQAERWGSNKKVHKCKVAIKEDLPPSVRPGATAKCRIFIANLPKVRKVMEGEKERTRKTLKVPIQSVVTTATGKKVCFLMKEGKPEALIVETGYYDETHVQIIDKDKGGLKENDTILKAPLLYAKELNVKGGLFGYRTIDAADLGIDTLAITTSPAKPDEAETDPKNAPSPPAKTVQAGKGRSGGGRPSGDRPGGGIGRSSTPPAELKLTAEQKNQWAAADKKKAEKRTDIMSRQAWTELRALEAEFNADLEKFLSKEQVAKYEQIRSQRSQSGKGKGGGGSSRRRGSLMDNDTDGDGKISEEEYSKIDARMRQFIGEFSAHDTNGDGSISKEEAEASQERMMQRLRQFQGGGGSLEGAENSASLAV